MKLSSILTLSLLVPAFAMAQEPSTVVNLAKPTNVAESWYFETHESGAGEMVIDEEAVTFKTTKITDDAWHVQVYQHGFDFEEGARYRVSFAIKSDERVKVLCHAMINEDDWHEIGLHEEIYCRPEYQKQEFTFQAEQVKAANNRLGFQLGYELGSVSVKDLVIEKLE